MRQRVRLSAAILAFEVALSLASGGVASAWSGDGGGPSWSLVDRGQKEDKAPKAKPEHPGKAESAPAQVVRPAPAPPPRVEPPPPAPAAPVEAPARDTATQSNEAPVPPTPTPVAPTATPDPNERVSVPGQSSDRSGADDLRRRLDAAALTPAQADALAAALGPDLTGDRLRAMKVSDVERIARERGLQSGDLAAIFPADGGGGGRAAAAPIGSGAAVSGLAPRLGLWQRLVGLFGWLIARWR